MTVAAAYLAIIVIWSTTPLAVKWSAVEAGFIFAVLSRMMIAAVFCHLLSLLIRSEWVWHKRAVAMYFLSGFNISFSMLLIYWGAQTISSGLIALIFGMMPLITGIFAALILKEKALTPSKLFGIFTAFSGLLLIFYSHSNFGESYILAIIAVLVAVCWHSMSTVVFKRYSSDLPILSVTTASIWVSVFFLLLAWIATGSDSPETLSHTGLGAILYLSIIGSVFGFTVYFYILKRMQATTIALIPLITPVIALLLGKYLNNETPDNQVWFGALLIITGLSLFQISSFLRRYIRAARMMVFNR